MKEGQLGRLERPGGLGPTKKVAEQAKTMTTTTKRMLGHFQCTGARHQPASTVRSLDASDLRGPLLLEGEIVVVAPEGSLQRDKSGPPEVVECSKCRHQRIFSWASLRASAHRAAHSPNDTRSMGCRALLGDGSAPSGQTTGIFRFQQKGGCFGEVSVWRTGIPARRNQLRLPS